MQWERVEEGGVRKGEIALMSAVNGAGLSSLRNVLLVDDSSLDAASVRRKLEEAGYSVTMVDEDSDLLRAQSDRLADILLSPPLTDDMLTPFPKLNIAAYGDFLASSEIPWNEEVWEAGLGPDNAGPIGSSRKSNPIAKAKRKAQKASRRKNRK